MSLSPSTVWQKRHHYPFRRLGFKLLGGNLGEQSRDKRDFYLYLLNFEPCEYLNYAKRI